MHLTSLIIVFDVPVFIGKSFDQSGFDDGKYVVCFAPVFYLESNTQPSPHAVGFLCSRPDLIKDCRRQEQVYVVTGRREPSNPPRIFGLLVGANAEDLAEKLAIPDRSASGDCAIFHVDEASRTVRVGLGTALERTQTKSPTGPGIEAPMLPLWRLAWFTVFRFICHRIPP